MITTNDINITICVHKMGKLSSILGGAGPGPRTTMDHCQERQRHTGEQRERERERERDKRRSMLLPEDDSFACGRKTVIYYILHIIY